MNTEPDPTNKPNENTSAASDGVTPKLILLGLDVHVAQITVCRQIDGLPPQPAQKFTQPKLLAWVGEQVRRGARVVCCYEAGPCGYVLHRALRAVGAESFVVAPQLWDEHGQRVKTDARDARALCVRLRRYLSGDLDAFRVVHVPTPEQEQRRALCRQRSAVVRQCRQMVVRARSLALLQGVHLCGRWWTPHRWPAQQAALPEPLRSALALWVQQAHGLDAQEKILRTQIEALAPPTGVPYGLGALSWVLCATEAIDWTRFRNRRQVSSYTGLCPSEHSSGARRHQGAINRHGNPRLRGVLIEAAWRLLRWQPGYWVWRKLPGLKSPGLNGRQRKRLIVAAARHLAVDLWRLATGRTTAEKLGLLLTTQPPRPHA